MLEESTTFCILGGTLIQNPFIIIFKIDKGDGLLDHFLILVPNALKPTPEEEEQATEYLLGLPIWKFQQIFRAMAAAHEDIIRTFSTPWITTPKKSTID